MSEVRKCRPLPEEKFKPLIKNNYYEERLFYFELDKGQYTRLRTLFLSSPLQEKMPRPSSLQVKMPHPQNAARQNNTFDALSSSEGYSGTSETLQEKEHSHPLVGNRDDLAPSWAGLFRKPSLPPNSLKNGETLDSSFDERSEQPVAVSFDSANAECDTDDVECWEDRAFVDDYMNETYPVEVGCSQHQDRENDVPELPHLLSSEDKVFLDGDDDELKPSDEKPVQAFIGTNGVKADIDIAPLENCAREPNLTERAFQEENSADSGGAVMECILTLLKEVEALKVSRAEQWQKIWNLERELV